MQRIIVRIVKRRGRREEAKEDDDEEERERSHGVIGKRERKCWFFVHKESYGDCMVVGVAGGMGRGCEIGGVGESMYERDEEDWFVL